MKTYCYTNFNTVNQNHIISRNNTFLWIISASSDWILTKFMLLDSSQWDKSNGDNNITLYLILAELFILKISDIFWNIFVNIDYKEMVLPPLELFHWDKSNNINFVEIQSLDAEIIHKNVLLCENHVIWFTVLNSRNNTFSQISQHPVIGF